MLTDLEAAPQYILKKLDVYGTLSVQVVDADAEKRYRELVVVVLVKKQSEEILKLFLSFQMMKKPTFIMD